MSCFILENCNVNKQAQVYMSCQHTVLGSHWIGTMRNSRSPLWTMNWTMDCFHATR